MNYYGCTDYVKASVLETEGAGIEEDGWQGNIIVISTDQLIKQLVDFNGRMLNLLRRYMRALEDTKTIIKHIKKKVIIGFMNCWESIKIYMGYRPKRESIEVFYY